MTQCSFQDRRKEVVYVDYGIANNFPDRIEINKLLLLPQYKELHDIILKHERDHVEGKPTLKDFALDIKAGKHSLQILKFVLENKSARREFNPFYKTEHGTYIDYSLLSIYILAFISMIGGILWILI